MLCTDDPEATLLKAVQVLLAYPELDTVAVVSAVRCTVVAHLTLGFCLAYLISRLRGSEFQPLAELCVRQVDASIPSRPQKIFVIESWIEAAHRPEEVPLWVLRESQTIKDLLAFFVATSHNSVPILAKDNCGCVLGMLSRRDVLRLLDLSLQSAFVRSLESAVVEDLQFDLEA